MEQYNNLPLFDVAVIYEDDVTGVDIISLVDRPAVQRDFMAFDDKEIFKLSLNDEKRIVTGPALITDKKIYREDAEGNPFYIQFSKESIETIAQKFFAKKHSTDVNLEHSIPVEDCVYFESYLINKERGICPKEYEDLPDGSWIVSCKINNPDVWELIKMGVLKGFSIEGNLRRTEAKKKDTIDSVEELMDYCK